MGEILDEVVVFERMSHGPSCVGRLPGGKVVMAPRAAPGDVARVRVVHDHRGYVDAEIEAVIERGPDWRDPVCRHARSGECGGCSWQHLTEEAQRTQKEAIVVREIARVAPEATVRPIRTDVPPFGYRRRTRLGYRDGVLGYRRRGERRIFDVWACPVLVPELEVALDEIRDHVADKRRGNVDVMVDRAGQVIIDGKAKAFAQPSLITEQVLVELVLEAVPDDAVDVEELFAGAGTFTIPMLERGHRVRAFEGDPQTVRLLRERAEGVVAVKAELLRPPVDIDLGTPDAVVLDPPRKGAAACIEPIVRSRVPVIVYVSCAPMTLCRDIGALRKAGYRVDWIQPVDAFPQTEHIECVTRLSRR